MGELDGGASALIEDVIDGVTTYRIDSGRPTLRATLMFRAGMVDETMQTSGWLHLLEHLALHGTYPPDVDYNGSVGLIYTSIDFHGPPEKVARYLTQAVSRLGVIDPDELTHEVAVLGAESSARGVGPVPLAMLWRYGPGGPGLAMYADSGLPLATPEALAAHRARFLTRGNAVLCLDGPVPDGLTLALPEGPPVPVPPVEPCAQPPRQRPEDLLGYAHEYDGILASATVGRGAAAPAYLRILHRRVVARLRHADGVSYSPWTTYEPVGADGAWLAIGADATADAAPTAIKGLRDCARELADVGPTQDEIDEDVAATVQNYRDPQSTSIYAWVAGRDRLVQRPLQSADELIADARAVTPQDVAAVASEALATLMVGVPGSMLIDALPLEIAPAPRDEALKGRRRKPVLGIVSASRLVLAEDRLQFQSGDSRTTVAFDEVAAALAWPDGARRLIRPDGYMIHVEPTIWRGGEKLVATIDARIPPTAVIPQRPRIDGDRPSLPSWPRRLWNETRHNPTGIVLWGLYLLVLVLFWIGWLATDDRRISLLRVPVAWTVVGAIVLYRRHRAQRT